MDVGAWDPGNIIISPCSTAEWHELSSLSGVHVLELSGPGLCLQLKGEPEWAPETAGGMDERQRALGLLAWPCLPANIKTRLVLFVCL